MRGPPMPANSIGRPRDLSAAMRWAPSWSPDASPATMPKRSSSATGLVGKTALASGKEIQNEAHFGAARDLRLELALRFVEAQPTAVQSAVGALQAGDRLGREAAALQPFAVDAVGRACG